MCAGLVKRLLYLLVFCCAALLTAARQTGNKAISKYRIKLSKIRRDYTKLITDKIFQRVFSFLNHS